MHPAGRGRARLLTDEDSAPAQCVNPNSTSPVALVCEHAGRAIPARLDGLGVSAADLERHIAWDLGAARAAHALAERLDAPLVAQRYSRLVIDCNRPPESPLATPGTSDGTDVPANRHMTAAERERRVEEIFRPWDAAVTTMLDGAPRRFAFAIHSFTPMLADGVQRPWDIGFLFRRDHRTSAVLAKYLRSMEPVLEIGMNQPYRIDDESDWFVPHHAEPRAIGHSLIEIRNDHLADAAGCDRWADRLADAIRHLLAEAD